MSTFKAADGVELYYNEIGRGPALVMLPGLGAAAKMWGDPPSPLTDHFRLLMPDLRGIGQSPCDPASVSLEAWTRDVGDLLDHLNIESAHVLGISIGGIIALDFASAHPSRVLSLAPIVTAAKSTPRLNNVFGCLRELALALPPDLFFHAFATLSLLPDTVDRAPKVVQRFSEAFDPADIPALARQCEVLLEGFDLTPRLKNITATTLVVSSMYDPITPISYGESIADAINARRLRLKKSGHAPFLEEPQNLLPALVRFWNEM